MITMAFYCSRCGAHGVAAGTGVEALKDIRCTPCNRRVEMIDGQPKPFNRWLPLIAADPRFKGETGS